MTASVLIPTRDRPDYLAVALASISPQAAQLGAEIVVVQDAAQDPSVAELAQRWGARYLAHGASRGPNAARNSAIAAASGDLLVFVDDDVEVWPGWLAALTAAAAALPEYEAFGGPIRPRIEGLDVHACGREDLPVTALDLGSDDRDAVLLWSANLAVRRSALERIGGFDETLEVRDAPRAGAATTYGDEEEWLRQLAAQDGRARYVAAAGVDHRRAGPEATWRSLARAAWFRGRIARAYDQRKGQPPSLGGELRVVCGSAWHIVRRRCGNGILLTAMNGGRLWETLAASGRTGPPSRRADELAGQTGTPSQSGDELPGQPGPDFLSGQSGTLGQPGGELPGQPGPDFLSGQSGTLGRRGAATAAVRDMGADAVTVPLRWALAARSAPRRRVLAVCVARPAGRARAEAAARELRRSRHDVEVRFADAAPGRGRWANAAPVLTGAGAFDWVLLFDDDVVLPRRFLDAFLACAEALDLQLAQPSHAYRSHAAWPVTRRVPGAAARVTRFVEQGPVLALSRDAVAVLFPVPELQMGWGLDNHWSAVAAQRGWPIGIVDATPVRHLHPVAGGYRAQDAVAEAEAFLADRPYVRRDEATTVRAVRWP